MKYNWEEVPILEEALNENKCGKNEPAWKFDCSFKLDFDGGLLTISSRFYPPNYGATWNGKVKFLLGEEIVAVRQFDCETLQQLKTEVEAYLEQVKEKIRGCLL